jgi:uncharacterized repeat protein (TIGR03833 family)
MEVMVTATSGGICDLHPTPSSMMLGAVSKKKEVIVSSDGSALKHNPFARLSALKVETKASAIVPTALSSAVPVARPDVKRPPPPCKVHLRLETTGRAGKAVTRIQGLPASNLDVIVSRLRKALGCGATVEGADVLLIGSLVERATQWLDKAGDLRELSDARPSSSQGTKLTYDPRTEAEPLVPLTQRSPMKRSDVRRGGRVAIVTKADQPTGNLTHGIVRDLLTNVEAHPRGIKVRLETGEIGRVRILYD